MRIKDTINISIRNLQTQKRRTILTMLGLIIGISSVVLILSVGAGTQSLITGQIQKRGTDQIAVLPGASKDNGPPAQALGVVITSLNENDRQAILKKNNVQHVKIATGYLSGGAMIQYQGQEKFITYTGTNANYIEQEKINVDYGRFFSPLEEIDQSNVVVIGASIAEDLFGNQSPVGEMVKIAKKQFKVIGVFEKKGSSGFENFDTVVVIPITVAQKKLKGVDYFSVMRMRLDDEKYLDQTVEQIKQTLIEQHKEEDFSVRTVADLLAILTTITNVIRFFLAAVAGMSLFVGGVGVMNIMLVSVKQKTREIGLRKAVGATSQNILYQFLIETVVISIIAGAIGIFFGVSIAWIISKVVQSLGYDYLFIITLSMIIVPLIVSSFVGLVFGLFPAKRAAEMDPISSLRYE